MAAAYIRRAIGIDQPEFSDDINEPLFRDTKGAKRQPVQDIKGRVRMAIRNNGVVLAAFTSALCLGLVSLSMLGGAVHSRRLGTGGGEVSRDRGRQAGDWGKTAVSSGASKRRDAAMKIEKQVDTVRSLEDNIAKMNMVPEGGGQQRRGRGDFLDPVKPVRQYIKYKQEKSGAAGDKWRGSSRFPGDYDNPFGNARTGKQWHGQFGDIESGRPTKYRRLINQHDEDWPTEPHVHPPSGFNVFDPKKNVFDVSSKPAVGMGKHGSTGMGGGMSAAMASFLGDDDQGARHGSRGRNPSTAGVDGGGGGGGGRGDAGGGNTGKGKGGVGSIDSLMKIAGAKPVETIGGVRGAPGGRRSEKGGGLERPAT